MTDICKTHSCDRLDKYTCRGLKGRGSGCADAKALPGSSSGAPPRNHPRPFLPVSRCAVLHTYTVGIVCSDSWRYEGGLVPEERIIDLPSG